MISGVFEATNDEVLTRPNDGEYLATRCGACNGYKRDALVGPHAKLFRHVTKFCLCAETKATLTLSTAELEKLHERAATLG